jgi:prepilin signal peptidase PulO-like enzyme (type II secretory pathway)
MDYNFIWILFSILFGLLLGNFIITLNYELPKDKSVFDTLFYQKYDNKKILIFLFPIFSYFLKKEKFENQDKKILTKYLFIELLIPLSFVFSYLKFGSGFNIIIFDLMLIVCIAMFINDIETFILPDRLQILFLILCVIFACNNNYEFIECILSSFVYFLVVYLGSYFVKKWKKEDSIGWGDLKFIAISSALLGFEQLPIFLLLSGLFGFIFGCTWRITRNEKYFPFAPAIIITFAILL